MLPGPSSGRVGRFYVVANGPKTGLRAAELDSLRKPSVGSDGRLWDTFDVYVGEELVFRDDRGEGRPPGGQGGRHDSGWQTGIVNLSQWRGQEVVVRFAVWNREYDGNGLDYYNTWAYLDEMRLQP